MIRIPKKVSERITKNVPRFQKVLADAERRDVSESDTVTIITDVLASVFGFDKYTEITSEQAIRGTFCDIAVKSGGKIDYLIEVKAIGLDLKENHLRQAVGYGVNHGIEWVVLTNSIIWEVYRIRFEQPVTYDLICRFNFLDLNPRKQDDQNKLFLLCKEGMDKAAIELFHEHVKSVNKYVIAALMQSDAVLGLVRRELRKLNPGLKVTIEEIEKILSTDVLKREVREGEEAKKAKKQVAKLSAKPKKAKEDSKVNSGEPVTNTDSSSGMAENETTEDQSVGYDPPFSSDN